MRQMQKYTHINVGKRHDMTGHDVIIHICVLYGRKVSMQEIQCGLESRPCSRKMEKKDREPDNW